jgi:hypothetical protein
LSVFADGDEWVEVGDVLYGFVVYFGLNVGCYVSGGGVSSTMIGLFRAVR